MLAAVLAGAAAGLASLPHCAAMCGPLAAYGGGGRRAVAFQGSRFAAYLVLGAVAGSVGHGLRALFDDARLVHVLLAGSLALGLGYAAWRLWRETSAAPAEPQLVQLGRKGSRRRLMKSALLGASTACLPCGALLAGALVAASAGSVLGGTLSMGAFALASAPGLLLAGFAGSRLRSLSLTGRRTLSVVLALGALVVAFRAVDAYRAEPPCCHAMAEVS